MARNEADREDLWSELVTASPRWELRVAGLENLVVTGMRSGDRLSVYFHGDRCYHFTAKGELRRAFVEGSLYRSAGNTLSRLVRERSSTETVLLRHDLSADELAEFLEEMRSWLQKLAAGLGNNPEVLRAFPEPFPAPSLLLPLLERIESADPPLSAALK